MAIEVRPCADLGELREAIECIGQYFGWRPSDEDLARWERNLRLEAMYAARDDGRIVGGAGAFDLELTVPGGTLPCAGVTVVAVHPTHRRRGVLTAMMRAQLDDAHERGRPLAALWSSEEAIYGRFGYGKASHHGEIRLARDRAAFHADFPREGVARIVEPDEALEAFPRVWDAFRLQRPGTFARSRTWWETRTLFDPEERRQGAGPKRLALFEYDGEPEAYAIYRHKPGWEEGSSVATTVVVEAIGATPRAEREAWRFLLDIDWAATVTASLLPPDHALFFLLAESRRMRYRMGDGLWLRLVDVGAALSGRSYSGDGRVVLEIADPFCPWNEGRWALEAGDAAPTGDEPDLRLDARELGSVFLGGFTFAQLARALRIEELRPGGAARADDLFRTDVAPWCPEIF